MNSLKFRGLLTGSLLSTLFFAGSVMAAESITGVSVDDTTPYPGQVLQVTVDANLAAANDDWQSSTIRLTDTGGIVGGTAVCIDDPDITDQSGTFQQVYSFTIPASVADGSYDVEVLGWKENACTNDFDGTASGTAAITVESQVNMEIAGTRLPNPVIAGSNQTWTITITNNGPNDATGVTVTTPWTLPAGVTATGNTPDVGLYDYNLWDVGAVASGTSLNLEVVLSVASSAAVCTNCILLSNATVGSTETETAPLDNAITLNASIDREYDLALAVVDAPDPVLAGTPGDYNLEHTFTLSRSGPSDAGGVTVAIVPSVPASGVTIFNWEESAGTFDGATWTLPDPWPASANGTDQTLTLRLFVDNTVAACTDCISATGTVSATDGGTDTDNSNDSDVNPTSVEEASDQTSTFATSVVFTNGFEGTVTATLTCTAGLPLEQDFDISEDSPVTFTMSDLPFTTPGTTCEITATGVDGYTIEASANGGTADDSCMYDSTTFDPSGANSCVFTATPNLSEFAVDIDFDGIDDPAIDLGWDLLVECKPAAAFEDSTSFPGVTWSTSGFGSYMNTFTFFAEPEDGSDCTATLSGLSTAIEQDSPCTVEEIAVGEADDPATDDSEAPTCSITATAFYEGIPTLSQYGLAIMALLMLGMGFIGFRRFV